jgi:hypothetical protein
MKLKTLNIELQPHWADNAGKYTGKIEYEGQKGCVTMNLSPEISNALLLCIGEVVTKFAADAAREVEQSLIASVAEAGKPLIENTPV